MLGQTNLSRATGPSAPTAMGTARPHPQDPLTAEELLAASAACRAHGATLGLPALRFNSVAAEEPNKHATLAFLRGEGPPPPRRALCVIQAPPRNSVIEALLDLDAPGAPALLSWKEMEGVQPPVTLDDVVESEEVLKRNPQFVAFMAERYGITDMAQVAVDPWYSGRRYGHPDGRLLQFFLYQRSHAQDMHYAHPLDAVITYDFNTDTIKDILITGDKKGQATPAKDYPWHRDHIDRPLRQGLKPINITQPEGPSFSCNGNDVEWLNWSFRVGFSWREGLILYNLAYTDGGRVRPVAYRAALAEIIVPYGDPRAPYQYKCAYDIVDYGLGFCANSLELGCDCLGAIKYFDAVLNDAQGAPIVIKKAICMHEEDYGIAYKHWEYRDDHTEVRRSRRLVISMIATIANYEYGFYWYLYTDGTIQFEAKLTGIVSTSALYPEEIANGGQPSNGTLVAPGVNAHIHQHFFQVRLDMAVDCPDGGRALRVSEINTEPMPLGPRNPYGVGFVATETLLETEQQAQRMGDTAAARAWKISNPAVLHPTTRKPVAWKLVPSTASPPMLAQPPSTHATRGAFATKHLWVTPYNEREMNPAGDYPLHPDPSQNPGIADWTQKNRCIVDADCVIWHTIGLTHIVRPEDFPVMPCEYVGFHLKPFGFFEVNPAMDLPPTKNQASRELEDGGACCPRSKL